MDFGDWITDARNIVFLTIVVFLLATVSWDQIFTALGTAPPDASLINPFHTSQLRDFNFWYFLIGTIGVVYVVMSWQGTQAYNASARSAHEAKMGQALAIAEQQIGLDGQLAQRFQGGLQGPGRQTTVQELARGFHQN